MFSFPNMLHQNNIQAKNGKGHCMCLGVRENRRVGKSNHRGIALVASNPKIRWLLSLTSFTSFNSENHQQPISINYPKSRNKVIHFVLSLSIDIQCLVVQCSVMSDSL